MDVMVNSAVYKRYSPLIYMISISQNIRRDAHDVFSSTWYRLELFSYNFLIFTKFTKFSVNDFLILE